MEKKNNTADFQQENAETDVSLNEMEQKNREGEENAANENISPESDVERLGKELAAQKDKYLRLVAEFDNFKRRTAKERMELIQTAGKDVITSMLDVLDDCDRAEKQMDTDDTDQIKTGVQLVFNKLRSTMQSKGLKPMESIDTDFDVHKHEAIAEVPADESKKGKVIDEIVKGYYLNDKIIRFAKVIVGK